MLILGLDPGGVGRFGWCVAESIGKGRVRLRESGIADHAAQALERASKHVANSERLVAAGVDSPLFWLAKGDRRADQLIRAAMKGLGATNVHGTVQQVNSLRGACLVQGVMAAHLLRIKTPQIRLTETHPKALLWLIKVASRQRRAADVRMENLVEFIECEATHLSEHERDAAIGAVGATAMLLALDGWKDLAADEDGAFAPVPPVEYWMPVLTTPLNKTL
jgi:hypothetical protein